MAPTDWKIGKIYTLSQPSVFLNLPVKRELNSDLLKYCICLHDGCGAQCILFLLCKNTVVSSGLRNNSTYKQFNGGFLSPPFPFNMEPSSVVSKGDLSFPTKPPLPQALLPYYSMAAKFSQKEDRIWQSLYQFPNPSSCLSKVWTLAASEHFHSSSATWEIQ